MGRNTFVVILLCTLFLSCILTGCHRSEAKKDWQGDFDLFLDCFKKMASQSRKNNNGSIDKSELEDIFLNKEVTWSGKLRYSREGRVYIEEAFIEVGGQTKLSAVMYYTNPDYDSQ